MKTFHVHVTREVTDLLATSVSIEAESQAEAVAKVQAMIERGHDFNLQYGTEIEAGPVEIEDVTEAEAAPCH